MYWDVTTVKPVNHLTLKVTFIDGLQGTVCFKPSFLIGVFESIKDESYFKNITKYVVQMKKDHPEWKPKIESSTDFINWHNID